MITGEDSSVVCFEEEDSPGQCLSFGAGAGSPFELPSFFNAPDLIGSFTTSDGVSVSSAGTETVAGQTATCYNVSSPDGDGKVCVADPGGQLLSVSVDDGELKFQLIVIEFGPSMASDFEPPFPVIDLG